MRRGPKPSGPVDLERAARIRAFRESGWTLAEIGRFYGITRARVWQVLRGRRK